MEKPGPLSELSKVPEYTFAGRICHLISTVISVNLWQALIDQRITKLIEDFLGQCPEFKI
jgi:hypothetical protein